MRRLDEATPLLLIESNGTVSGTNDVHGTHEDDDTVSQNHSTMAASSHTTSTILPHRRPQSDSHHSSNTATTTSTAQLLSEIVADVTDEWLDVLQEDVITPIKPREEGDHSYKLSAVALAVMVFYKVSGGPFGCEPTVQAAGPFYAIVGFIVFPILWSIPEAFITAELGSAYPEPSGRTLSFFSLSLVLFCVVVVVVVREREREH